MVDQADKIAFLQVAAGIGSRAAAARLREIENDDDQPDVIRTAAQRARHHAKAVAYICGLGGADGDDMA